MFSALLLAWYDQHRRILPFRGTKDPYRIWVSEIMLQQTRTETVGAYYERFLKRFPDVFALAEAPEQDVLKCWEGLGYYSRARNLHKAAQQVVNQYNGVFPADLEALRALPGVGNYTAAAVASIAFDLLAPAMDGNLTRVLSRFHGVREDVGIPSVKRRLLDLAREDMPAARCGDFNQALMDLGAMICVPGTPDCESCPLRPLCSAYQAGDAEDLPIKTAARPPKEIPLAVILVTCRGRIWMCERKEALLRGLWVYCLAEGGKQEDTKKALESLGIQAKCLQTLGPARHVFTHRIWNMTVYHFETDSMNCREGRFVSLPEMLSLPMPTAMRTAREWALRLLTPKVLRADNAILPAIAAAYTESWKNSHAAHCSSAFLQEHTPEHMEMILRGHLGAGRDVFGLWQTETIVGVLVIDRAENELVSLYIHPDYQSLGLGKAAVTFAIGVLDERRDMKVTNLCDNERARHLYESFGFCHIEETRLLNPERNISEETRIRKGRYFLPLSALHPSQLYISEEKLAAVRAWFDPENLIGFDPVPVKKRADGLLYLTDGHTRAVAAYLAGMKEIPVCDEWEELSWEAYDESIRWCDAEGADTIEKLAKRIVSPEEYQILWNDRCDQLHRELEEKRHDA
ncbi:MAG: A/G-specific adenine glycosylase [Clostridia bacterium]|nr:A/G-specific adenine glycosylase [Clostridia bacterium]